MEETEKIIAAKSNHKRRRRRPASAQNAAGQTPAPVQNAQNGGKRPARPPEGERRVQQKDNAQTKPGNRPAHAQGETQKRNGQDGRGRDNRGGRRPQGGRSRRAEVPDDMEIRSYHNDYTEHYDTDVEQLRPREETAHNPDSEDAGSGIVIGRNAVRELLKSDRAIDKLLVRRGDREGSIVVLVAEAVSRGIPVVEADKNKMDAIAGFAPHQGVIAMAAEKEYVSVDDMLKIAADRGEVPLLVVADGIVDPYNLGALIRCAEGAGAHGLIIPKRRAVGLTPAVSKASAGAIEHLAIAKVANISAVLDELKKKGVWTYAAEAGGAPYYETDFAGPAAIVFGSEGDGIQDNVKKKCDFIVSIPMYGRVNSFNVSTAASVLLCEAARRHHGGER